MKQNQKGFTLVEIAIVLVIIGLLLGGILKGQEMIVSGQVRNVIDQGEQVTASVFAFQDRFRAVPGDYNGAQATIPNCTAAAPIICLDGGGDGSIGTNDEHGSVWTHLALSGFLSGTYDGVGLAAGFVCPQATCPANAFGGTMMLSTGSEAAGTLLVRGELLTGANVPITVLAQIDRKVDDGAPLTGSLRISDTHVGACENAGVYDIANAPDASCGGVYRNF